MGFLSWLRLQWDRVGAWACIALGLLCLLLGYIGISATPHVAEQLPYIVSGGLTGIFLLGLGGLLLLSADLSDEWRKLDDLERTISAQGLQAPTPAPPTATELPVVLTSAPRPRRTSATRTGGQATKREFATPHKGTTRTDA